MDDDKSVTLVVNTAIVTAFAVSLIYYAFSFKVKESQDEALKVERGMAAQQFNHCIYLNETLNQIIEERNKLEEFSPTVNYR